MALGGDSITEGDNNTMGIIMVKGLLLFEPCHVISNNVAF